MGLAESLLYNWQDAREIGAWFPLRHLSSLLRTPLFRASLRGYGDIYLRPHTKDAHTFREIFTAKEYRIPKSHTAAVQAAHDRIIAAGRRPLIIDAGANVGAASIWFAMQYPDARVLAIEPEPSIAAICRKNVEAAPNVEVVEAAIGATPGHVSLSPPGTESFAIQTTRQSAQADAGSVRIVTISELLEASPDQELLIAKVDIEGFEADLFAQNIEWLDSLPVLIIEPHDWMLPGSHSSGALQKAMFGRGFELMISGENLIFIR